MAEKMTPAAVEFFCRDAFGFTVVSVAVFSRGIPLVG